MVIGVTGELQLSVLFSMSRSVNSITVNLLTVGQLRPKELAQQKIGQFDFIKSLSFRFIAKPII